MAHLAKLEHSSGKFVDQKSECRQGLYEDVIEYTNTCIYVPDIYTSKPSRVDHGRTPNVKRFYRSDIAMIPYNSK